MNRASDAQRERGAIAVITVTVFTVLLLFLGMSADYGMWLRYRRAMQNACDSGALAGALNLRMDPTTAAPTAERYAANDMTTNNIEWDTLQATTLDDNNQTTLIAPRRVRVEIHRNVEAFLFRLVGINTVHVAVDCTARLTPIILANGLVPIGLNYNEWATQAACTPYFYLPLNDPGRPAQCRSFALTLDISDKTNPWGSGNTGLLSMNCFDCPSGGGSQWLENFKYGTDILYCYDMNPTPEVTGGDYPEGAPSNCANVKTEPGVKIGPINSGVDYRCLNDNPLDDIIMLPLLNPAYMASDKGGTYTTEIWGFAAYQLDCVNTKLTGANPTIQGGFISKVSMQWYGTETAFDTGVYTIKLIE